MPQMVKSALRVFEVLELFDRLQRALTVGEIARELHYPLSSTSILLGNMLDLEYLRHGPDGRSYFPTFRVTQLGAWIEPLLTPSGDLLLLMDELAECTGQTVILAVPKRDQAQYVHVVSATSTKRIDVGRGTMRPLVSSNLGRLILSAMPDERVRYLILSHKEGPSAAELPISLAALERELAGIHMRGHLVTMQSMTPGVSSIGRLLPVKLNGLPVAVCIAGGTQEIKSRQLEYVSLLREVVVRRFRA